MFIVRVSYVTKWRSLQQQQMQDIANKAIVSIINETVISQPTPSLSEEEHSVIVFGMRPHRLYRNSYMIFCLLCIYCPNSQLGFSSLKSIETVKAFIRQAFKICGTIHKSSSYTSSRFEFIMWTCIRNILLHLSIFIWKFHKILNVAVITIKNTFFIFTTSSLVRYLGISLYVISLYIELSPLMKYGIKNPSTEQKVSIDSAETVVEVKLAASNVKDLADKLCVDASTFEDIKLHEKLIGKYL
ncbi:hypothetical protein U3516DRAFT_742833 [Neocallimastix sp. 'constans']